MKCGVCGMSECRVGWHAFASNTSASNTGASNSASNASVARDQKAVGSKPEKIVVEDVGAEARAAAVPEQKQRWSRGAYNAYQRDLMRVRRVKARGEV